MDDWMKQFSDWGVIWTHDGNPKRPHAELTSGKHSDGFFNGSLLIQRQDNLQEVARALVSQLAVPLTRMPGMTAQCGWVIGSAMGAVTLAHEVARFLPLWATPPSGACCGFTEPQPDKTMLLKRFDVQSGDRVLVVEDVLTTGGTTESTIKAIESAGGIVLPVLGVIFNRSGKDALGDRRIVSLVAKELSAWEPAECPLCKVGSRAVRPKANWAALTAAY